MRWLLLAAALGLASLAACESPSDGGGLYGDAWWKQSRSVQVGASPERVVDAVVSAFGDLLIDVRRREADDARGAVEGRTSRGQRVSVGVESTTPAASRLTVRVDFGDEEALQRILDEVLAAL